MTLYYDFIMNGIDYPWIDRGQFLTREGLIVWLKRGSQIFLALVVMIWAIALPLSSPVDDGNPPESQQVETAVGGPSSVVNITVTATPDYHGNN
jgi:hypothetical protein